MADTYFCNFSLFQSCPDSWAIKQLFPVMPIHNLNVRPTQHGVSATSPAIPTARSTSSSTAASGARCRCRSTATPTTSACFVGAYQEILGDLHNLFGDTHAVHVSLDDRGNVVLDAVIKGDTVREVLDYVEFDAETLVEKLRRSRTCRESGKIATKNPEAP